MDFEAEIGKRGIEIHHKTEWVDIPEGGRKEVSNPTKVESVNLNFTPEEWSRLVVRDGDEYIGGCCGTTGAMQDIICSVHRDGGYIRHYELQELGFLGSSHDGHEWWSEELTEKKFQECMAKWDSLSLWDRIGLVFQICSPKLSDGSTIRKKLHETDLVKDKHVLDAVRNGLTIMRWNDLFHRDPPKDPAGEAFEFQRHTNRQILISRIIPPARRLIEVLTALADQPFNCVCLVHQDKPDTLLENGYGLAIYKDEAQVNALFQGEQQVKFNIRPCQISMEKGIVFTDKLPHVKPDDENKL